MALDPDRAAETCGALQKMDAIFHVGGGIGVGLFAEIYLRSGKTEEALEYLEKMAEELTKEMEPPNPLLFAPAVAPKPEQLKWNKEIRMVILHGLEKDACFEPLRGDERFRKLTQKIAESLEE